ncbi:hypothetical protein T06_11437 [Trichinella sp. T6]|nr:hypothetical protein T06_9220 [Trichinella sp. T6]KRX32788.1 hypothetical protein T06_7213 [Trichinella sp. T6]KRX33034.1 hypothetical protein T06_7296 [Trichinella sp. T6]KRX48758.1 hypothetical protein T06_11437 [Trichinella sp. T6]
MLYYKNGNQEQFLLDGTSLFYGKRITYTCMLDVSGELFVNILH